MIVLESKSCRFWTLQTDPPWLGDWQQELWYICSPVFCEIHPIYTSKLFRLCRYSQNLINSFPQTFVLVWYQEIDCLTTLTDLNLEKIIDSQTKPNKIKKKMDSSLKKAKHHYLDPINALLRQIWIFWPKTSKLGPGWSCQRPWF